MSKSGLMPFWRGVAACLIVLLCSDLVTLPLSAQAQPRLTILIIEGEGAINNIRQRTAREPIVQVEDENKRPVAGAVVVFSLPDRGASGAFANGAQTMSVVTNSLGRAVASGLRPNNVSGNFQIQVNASYQGQTATATITQVNAAVAGGIAVGKILAILGIAGGAAAGAIVAATRNNDRPRTTVSFGNATVGPPR